MRHSLRVQQPPISAQHRSPRPQGRGPIAARPTRASPTSPPRLHGLRAVAPLRHGKYWEHLERRELVSTASGPWPHCGEQYRAYMARYQPRLHGLRAVAPLRHAAAPGTAAPPRGVSTASGPWPHCGESMSADGFTRERRLHGLRAVAPLRQGPAQGPAQRGRPSPRPQGRGPIAASRCVPASPASFVSTASGPWPHCGNSMFPPFSPEKRSPRPQGRGPIAAPAGWSSSWRSCGSPRPQGRGPIAASLLLLAA